MCALGLSFKKLRPKPTLTVADIFLGEIWAAILSGRRRDCLKVSGHVPYRLVGPIFIPNKWVVNKFSKSHVKNLLDMKFINFTALWVRVLTGAWSLTLLTETLLVPSPLRLHARERWTGPTRQGFVCSYEVVAISKRGWCYALILGGTATCIVVNRSVAPRWSMAIAGRGRSLGTTLVSN